MNGSHVPIWLFPWEQTWERLNPLYLKASMYLFPCSHEINNKGYRTMWARKGGGYAV